MEMEMEGYSVAAVRLVVDFMYHNQIRISDVDQALDVLVVATRWQMDDQFLKQVELIVTNGLTAENCLNVRDHLLREDHHLVASVDQFIFQNFKKVTNSDIFKTANLLYVLNLFDSDELQVEDEKEVYESGLRWVNSDRRGREDHMCSVMKTVRMGLMNFEDLASICFDILCKYTEELDDYINENMNYVRSNRFKQETKSNMKSATKRRCQIAKKTLMCLGGRDDIGKRFKSVVTSENDGVTWNSADDMLVERSSFSATVCSGSLFVVGGLTSANTATKSCEKYDIRSKLWTRSADLPETRYTHSASCVSGQQLYVIGGKADADVTNTVLTLEDFDGDNADWTAAPSMKQRRSNHISCCINDALYVVGGCDGRVNLKSCEMLNLNSNTWRSIAPTHYAHQAAGACTDGEHHIYVAGRFNESYEKNVEVYDVTMNQWSVLRAPPTAVSYALSLVHHQDKVYAVGGADDNHDGHDVVQVLDTVGNSWSVVAHLPTPRIFHVTVTF